MNKRTEQVLKRINRGVVSKSDARRSTTQEPVYSEEQKANIRSAYNRTTDPETRELFRKKMEQDFDRTKEETNFELIEKKSKEVDRHIQKAIRRGEIDPPDPHELERKYNQ